MAHRVMIGGTAYEVKGGSVMVDGTVYQLTKGQTLIDGTGYEISFDVAPDIGTKWVLSEVGDGTWECPADGTYEVEMHGGGGGGGGQQGSEGYCYAGSGAGSGELYTMTLQKGTVAYTVGAGGEVSRSGVSGGSTTFNGQTLAGGNGGRIISGSNYTTAKASGSLATDGSYNTGLANYIKPGGYGNKNNQFQTYGNGGNSISEGADGGIIITYMGGST